MEFEKLDGEVLIDDILKLEFEDHPLPFLTRDDVFQVGASHLIAAPTKTGKSTILRRLCNNWSLDGHPLLYFSEEFERVWKYQATELQIGPGGADFVVVPALGIPVPALLKRAETGPEEIIVIDTTRSLLGIQSLQNSDEVVAALRPWVMLTRTGKTLIFSHHMNKSGPRRYMQFGQAIAGGHGLQGAVDAVIEYSEIPNDPTARLIQCRSRLNTEQVDFVVRKKGSLFTAEEAPDELILTDTEKEIFLVLQPDKPQTIAELMKKTEFPEAKVRRGLKDLTDRGLARDTTGNSRVGGKGMAAAWVLVTDDE